MTRYHNHRRQTPSAILNATVTRRETAHRYPPAPDPREPIHPERDETPPPYLITQTQPIWDGEGD